MQNCITNLIKWGIVLLFIFPLQNNLLKAQLLIGNAEKLSEEQLLLGIRSMSVKERVLCAKEIRNRIKRNEIVVMPGNIFEHSADYWKNKLKGYYKFTNYDKFEREFNLKGLTRTPNYGNVKVYRLDHMYILSVKQNKRKTKIKITRLEYSPEYPDLYNIKMSENFSGEWPIYNVTGILSSVTSYNKGKRDGDSIIYYDNGSPCWVKYYRDGKILGMDNYSEDGQLKSSEVFTESERKKFEEELRIEEQLIKE